MKDLNEVVLVVKLKRTDTTLDLSQKARVVKKARGEWGDGVYVADEEDGPCALLMLFFDILFVNQES